MPKPSKPISTDPRVIAALEELERLKADKEAKRIANVEAQRRFRAKQKRKRK